MKLNGVTSATCALMLAVAGCTDDVGECFKDGKQGHDTVFTGGHVEFGGQAIINRACATGCHSSKAKGEARQGAPAGLDFDLEPVDGTGVESGTTQQGNTFGKLEQDDINGLRERQRKVFSERNLIWQQVKDGLMPPGGQFSTFKKITSMILDTDEKSPCMRGAALKDIENKATQDILRNWLACQAPIVESYGGPASVDGVDGTAGYQYLECSGSQPMGDGGMGNAVTFETVYDTVLTDATCVGCHPSVDKSIDLSTVDIAYMNLVEDTSSQCDDKPFVKAGDPDNSFLVDLVSLDKPCTSDPSIQRMPVGSKLSNSQIQVIRDWIEGGALRESALIQAPLKLGLDAGVRN